MLPQKVIALAQKVREEVEVWVYPNSDINCVTLQGACLIASYALYQVLKANSYSPKLVLGTDWKLVSSHAWIELDGYVLDITSTQFGYKKEVLAIKADRYRLRKQFADTNISQYGIFERFDWGGQSPVMYKKEIKDLTKALTSV